MSDEPTKIRADGAWTWLNSEGHFHRDNDLPAVIYPNGHCQWWQNGELHRRNDLPAKIFPNGKCQWWVDSNLIKEKQCTQEEIEEWKKPYYFQKTKKIKFDRFEKLIKGTMNQQRLPNTMQRLGQLLSKFGGILKVKFIEMKTYQQ